MTAAAAAAGRPDLAQLGVHLCRGTGRSGGAQTMHDGERLAALGITQPIAACRVLGDRLAHHLALRLAQPRRRPANLRDRFVAERERDPNHTRAILPYATAV